MRTGLARPAASRLLPDPLSPLAQALGPALGDRRPATVVGVEHEYSLARAGDRLDFRTLIHELDIAGRRLDPGDANAYRCPSGLVVTCDAEDAEVVSPPLPVQPGVAAEVARWADHGWAELRRLVPPDISVTPFSTHVSASMPDDLVGGVADLFARTFAPALMLMLDRADSHGVFVRPRPGRLELCGEHATGPRLGAAAVLVAGGARACAASGPLPPPLAVDVRPATGRHGLFVGRHLAFGYDLYAGGRRAVLPLQSGGTLTADAHLVAAWEAARDALGADVSPADLAAGDAMVSGSMPLGIEDRGAGAVVSPPWPPAMRPSPFGDVVEPRVRPGFDVTPVAATWAFTVFRLDRMAREAYACVPGPHLGAFLERLDTGALDDIVVNFIGGDPTGSVLFAHDQTAVPGLWDRAVIGPDLLPYERPAAVAGAVIDDPAPASYVRSRKAAVVLPAPASIPPQPIVAVGEPPTVPAAVPPPAPPPEPARPSAPTPPLRPARRRRPARVAVLALLTLLLAGGAAALAGVFGNGDPSGVAIVSGPGVAPTSSGAAVTNGSAPPSSAIPPASPATSEPTAVTTVPVTLAPSASTTIRSTPVPTGPATTAAPVQTTVALDTTTIATATTTTVTTATTTTLRQPASLVVAVTSGILGCSFQPASASAVAGSTVRFRNDTGGSLNLAFTPPVGDGTTVSLEAGGSSGAFVLASAGSYGVTCSSGTGSTIGRLTIMVTNA